MKKTSRKIQVTNDLDKRLRQAALAKKADMARPNLARPNLARIEAGRYRPALETLERIASALGYSVGMLVSAQTIPHKERQKKMPRKRKAA